MQVLKDEAPNSFKETNRKTYANKIIAIDISMQLYQFLVQIKMENERGFSQALRSENGDVTSHLMGILNRTVTLMELGIRPVYVFDGKPPALKMKELVKRKELKLKAQEKYDALVEVEEVNESVIDEMNKMAKRNVTITPEQINDTKRLLDCMGIPWIQAPSEAEAQCAKLVSSGKVHATGTEDMDCLTFGSTIMLKNLTDSKKNVIEISLAHVLNDMKLTREQFVDFCILCGCDYTESIKGIGPKRGLALIRKFKTIEEIAKNLDPKYNTDDIMANLYEIRHLFNNPVTIDSSEIKIKFDKLNEKSLLSFLVTEKGFNEERVQRVINRINKLNKTKENTIYKYFSTNSTEPSAVN